MNEITPEQILEYQKLERLALAISSAVSAFDLGVLQADIPQEVKARCLEATNNMGIKGLAYRLHPKSEWAGGDQWRILGPIIAREHD